MTDPTRRGGLGRAFFERGVAPYLRDSTLWPVAIVLLAHVVAFLAPLCLLAFRDGERASAITLAVLGSGSAVLVGLEWRAIRRPGEVTGLLAGIWAASAALALAADHYGVF